MTVDPCTRCGRLGHSPEGCSWPTDTDDEPVRVPYIPPVYDDPDLYDFSRTP